MSSNHRFSIIQGKAVSDMRVTDAQLRTLSALGMYADKDGWCFPSQSTLAEDIGKSRQTVNSHIAALVELGYVESHANWKEDGSQTSNSYRLLFDFRQGVSNLDLTGGVKPRLDTNDPSNDPSNNTGSEGKTPSSAAQPLPIEWQILAGKEKIEMPDEQEMRILDTADLIAMGTGINHPIVKGIAYAFMKTRGIIIPTSKVKGQRKAIKDMVEQNVLPSHVAQATEKLMAAGMTTTDLYSISKTAIDIANPAPQSDFSLPQESKFTSMDELEDE